MRRMNCVIIIEDGDEGCTRSECETSVLSDLVIMLKVLKIHNVAKLWLELWRSAELWSAKQANSRIWKHCVHPYFYKTRTSMDRGRRSQAAGLNCNTQLVWWSIILFVAVSKKRKISVIPACFISESVRQNITFLSDWALKLENYSIKKTQWSAHEQIVRIASRRKEWVLYLLGGLCLYFSTNYTLYIFCCILWKQIRVSEPLQDLFERQRRVEEGGTDRNVILFVTARSVL